RVVRPLLETRRHDIVAYLAASGQSYCEDETNRDLSIPRNRIRQELIPYIERELSPGIVQILARAATAARRDEDHLSREAIESSGLIVLRTRDHRTVRLSPEAVLPVDPAEVAAVELDA